MKKPLIIIGLCGVVILWLRAQEVQQIVPETAAPLPAEGVGPATTQPPVLEIEPADPVADEISPVPVDTAAVEVPVVQEAPVLEIKAEPEAPVAEADEINMIEKPAPGAEMMDGRVSLSLTDVELQDVIRLFSRLSNANIIIPDLGEEIAARKVDINLADVEWKPSLQAILDTHGLELYEKMPGSEVYSIREKAADAPEPQEVRVFKLNYASSADITELITGLIGDEGIAASFPARNTVVLQGTAKRLKELEEIIGSIDLPRQQVFIEAKFLELSDSAQKDLGINWQVLQAYNITASGLEFNRTSTKNISDGTTRYYDVEGNPFEMLDSSSYVDDPSRSINDPFLSRRFYGITPTKTKTETETVEQTLTAVLNADDFNLVLSALEQQDGIDIVSNPKIIVANEETATIHLGIKEPNIRIEKQDGTTDNPGGTVTVTLDPTVPYFEDGVKVVVTPTINTSSNITVAIEPELTTFTDRKTVEQDGYTLVDFPISRTKTVNTIFSLESGQTAAIGGLTQTTEQNVVKKVPFLGNLPVLRRLFSYEQMVKEQDETIIFVTVGLANPDNIDMETGLPQRTRLAQRYNIRETANDEIAKESLQLYRQKESDRQATELEALQNARQKLTASKAPRRGFFRWLRSGSGNDEND
ncbi:MAG: secretin N-terminal domain-containing protein [Kiritimatiellales bacterium]